MKKLLNTLFVMTQGAYLAKDGETVVVKHEGQVKIRLPIHNLSGIICFGNVGCSPFLMGHCAKNQVGLSFLTENGRFLAKATGKTSGNVLLRREQYRRTDDPTQTCRLAANIVTAKIANCRTVLARGLRDHEEKINAECLRSACNRLANIGKRAMHEQELESLRGLEGEAARLYFSTLGELVTSQKNDFPFSSRNRRPPMDRMNALLSFIYVILAHDVESALECVGLDPQVGFLHRERPGRASLALDIMEELRPVIADRLALSLVNRQQIKIADFNCQESGAVLMNEKGRKTVLKAYQERKQQELEHQVIGEKIKLGTLPYAQALLLARTLRADNPEYIPYLWR